MRRSYLYICGLIFCLGCSGWQIDDIRLNEDAQFDIPLFKTEFSLDQIIDTSGGLVEVRINQDKIELIFKGEPLQFTPEDVLPSFPTNIPIPLLDTNSQINLGIVGGVSISKIILADDSLHLGFAYSSASPIEFSLEIPSLALDGNSFHFKTTLESGIAKVINSDPVPLSGYELNLEDNLLRIKYQALKNGEPIRLPWVTLSFSAFDFTYFQGKLGKFSLPQPVDSIEIDIFKNWEGGTVQIENPTAHFKALNSFGIPMAIQTHEMYIFSKNGSKKLVTSPLFESPIAFAHPSLDQVGTVEETFVEINPQNSNISDIVEEVPSALYYYISGVINPEELNEDIFLTNKSKLQIESEINIPVYGKLENYIGYDTIPIVPWENTNFRQATLHLYTENEMPVEVTLEAVLLDSAKTKIGNLWEGPLLLALAADQNKVPDGEQISKHEVPLSLDLLQQLRENSSIGLKISLKTTSAESAQVTTQQTVRIFAGIKLVLD